MLILLLTQYFGQRSLSRKNMCMFFLIKTSGRNIKLRVKLTYVPCGKQINIIKKMCFFDKQSMSHSLLFIPFFGFTFIQKKKAFSHDHLFFMTEAGFLLTIFLNGNHPFIVKRKKTNCSWEHILWHVKKSQRKKEFYPVTYKTIIKSSVILNILLYHLSFYPVNLQYSSFKYVYTIRWKIV